MAAPIRSIQQLQHPAITSKCFVMISKFNKMAQSMGMLNHVDVICFLELKGSRNSCHFQPFEESRNFTMRLSQSCLRYLFAMRLQCSFAEKNIVDSSFCYTKRTLINCDAQPCTQTCRRSYKALSSGVHHMERGGDN